MFVDLKGIRSKKDIPIARGLIENALAVLKGITLRLQTSDGDPENLYPVQGNPLRRNNKAPLPPHRTLLETVTFQRNRESHSLNQAFSEAGTFQE